MSPFDDVILLFNILDHLGQNSTSRFTNKISNPITLS
jgi:hypothetical protein